MMSKILAKGFLPVTCILILFTIVAFGQNARDQVNGNLIQFLGKERTANSISKLIEL